MAEEAKRAEALHDAELIRTLKARDLEVRSHEAAHRAVGGALTGPATFTFESGPDGRAYAVGGEVSIDTSPEATPDKTAQKMERVIAAALAPAEPSAQDLAVAAQARQALTQARQEAAEVSAEERVESRPGGFMAERAVQAYQAAAQDSVSVSASVTQAA